MVLDRIRYPVASEDEVSLLACGQLSRHPSSYFVFSNDRQTLYNYSQKASHYDAIGGHSLSDVMSRLATLEYQIVDRLSSDENGELLLQPLGYCRDLVHGLAGMAVDEGLPLERRTDSARALLGITQKAAQEHIVFVNARTVCFGQPFETRQRFNAVPTFWKASMY